MYSESSSVEVVNDRDRHVLLLSGELDLAGAPRLAEFLATVGRSSVVVDLGGLTFIDAAGISVFVRAKKPIEDEGDEFRIVNAHGLVRKVFDIVGLSALLT